MNTEKGYRFEYKYLIGREAAEELKHTLPLVFARDIHAGEKGYYDIRSVYFDDPEDNAYEEKEAGVADRRKYRIRFYDLDPSFVTLELKLKKGILSQKTAETVTFEEAETLLGGGRLPAARKYGPALATFTVETSEKLLEPRLVVDYRRYPFVYPVGNTRVTIDTLIRGSRYERSGLLAEGTPVPALEEGLALLEVKFDRELPCFIGDFLSRVPLVHYANSKYCSCHDALFIK